MKFPIDNELLAQLMTKFSECPIRPSVEIGYTISNPEPVRNELLAKAVADSTAKAKIMTSAAGAQLGEVIDIDYSWNEINIYHRDQTFRNNDSMCIGSVPDFTPEDMDLSDTVTVIWEIV